MTIVGADQAKPLPDDTERGLEAVLHFPFVQGLYPCMVSTQFFTKAFPSTSKTK